MTTTTIAPGQPTAAVQTDLDLMQRIALTRLRRFERVAAAANESGSPLWRRLASHAATAALRDCLLLGLAPDAESVDALAEWR